MRWTIRTNERFDLVTVVVLPQPGLDLESGVDGGYLLPVRGLVSRLAGLAGWLTVCLCRICSSSVD